MVGDVEKGGAHILIPIFRVLCMGEGPQRGTRDEPSTLFADIFLWVRGKH